MPIVGWLQADDTINCPAIVIGEGSKSASGHAFSCGWARQIVVAARSAVLGPRHRCLRIGDATRILVVGVFMLIGPPSSSLAQTRAPDLSQLSIEDLMNIEITSASRKQERATDVAAAVFVITEDDIRRSGMTTIPDLLRMAPGVDVAQINASQWAVSVRGFNGIYANKLLVLVDGRSIYNRIFSGVLWDTADLPLDDIDRIEVIRGPGAAMWGANAVNAVINIVTKTTAQTQGALVRVEGGRFGEQASVRYGGTLGAATYRLYSQWSHRDESVIAAGTRANDAAHSTTTGGRAEWATQLDAFMVEGDFTAGQARILWPNFDPATAARDPIANSPTDTQGGHLLGRWTHTRTGGASLRVQSFLDIAGRQEPLGDYQRRSFDLDTQYHSALGARHDLVAGVGYRFIDERFDGHIGFSLTPPQSASSLVSAFVQDQIALLQNRLAVTLGSQVQYDSDSGAGVQPTARVMWKGFPRQRLWAAVSRALRTPALADRGFRVNYPPVLTETGLPLIVTSVGNPNSETETFVDAEAGYRVELGTRASLDVTSFVGRYDHLVTAETAAPSVQFTPSPVIIVVNHGGNRLKATTRGLEIAAHWTPVSIWRLDGSYTAFHLVPDLADASLDVAAATTDGNAPRAQWQLRSSFTPPIRATLAVAIFHVSSLEGVQVPAYTRADVTAEMRFNKNLSAMVIGQNLLSATHAEFGGVTGLLQTTQVARSASLRLRWTFR
jgi:iron complex outermembrane receptor protein